MRFENRDDLSRNNGKFMVIKGAGWDVKRVFIILQTGSDLLY